MRLPKSAHTSLPWRIHQMTEDFQLEDVWALPTPGGPDEFPRLLNTFFSGKFPEESPLIVKFLWAARWKIGEWLHLDSDRAGVGTRVASLTTRLPADLRELPEGPDLDGVPFSSLYLLPDEWAAEMANRTVHGVLHLSWVPSPDGGYRGQMAVLVRPNGLLGKAYMAAIKPFRYALVYPALIGQIGRNWNKQHQSVS